METKRLIYNRQTEHRANIFNNMAVASFTAGLITPMGTIVVNECINGDHHFSMYWFLRLGVFSISCIIFGALMHIIDLVILEDLKGDDVDE